MVNFCRLFILSTFLPSCSKPSIHGMTNRLKRRTSFPSIALRAIKLPLSFPFFLHSIIVDPRIKEEFCSFELLLYPSFLLSIFILKSFYLSHSFLLSSLLSLKSDSLILIKYSDPVKYYLITDPRERKRNVHLFPLLRQFAVNLATSLF